MNRLNHPKMEYYRETYKNSPYWYGKDTINNKKIIVLKKEYIHKIEQDSLDFFVKNNILIKTI